MSDQQATPVPASEAPTPPPDPFPLETAIRPVCNDLRAHLQDVENHIRGVKAQIGKAPQGGDKGEVVANLTLAIRHTEDARMRLGKALQHARDGVSTYDGSKSQPIG